MTSLSLQRKSPQGLSITCPHLLYLKTNSATFAPGRDGLGNRRVRRASQGWIDRPARITGGRARMMCPKRFPMTGQWFLNESSCPTSLAIAPLYSAQLCQQIWTFVIISNQIVRFYKVALLNIWSISPVHLKEETLGRKLMLIRFDPHA